MLRRIILTAGLTLAFTLQGVHPAGAATLVTPDGQTAQPYQAWADAAKVPTAPVTLIATGGGCPGEPGRSCAVPAGNGYQAQIWLCTEPLCSAADDEFHELGHQFDYAVMTPAARAAFLKIERRPTTTPWAGEAHAEPHEQFAEAYRICAWGWTYSHAASETGIGYDYSVNDRQQRRACALINRVARRAGLARATR